MHCRQESPPTIARRWQPAVRQRVRAGGLHRSQYRSVDSRATVVSSSSARARQQADRRERSAEIVVEHTLSSRVGRLTLLKMVNDELRGGALVTRPRFFSTAFSASSSALAVASIDSTGSNGFAVSE